MGIKTRFILVSIALVLALVLFLPSTPVSRFLPGWWKENFPKIALGLDLQGGMYLLLKVDTEKALENRIDSLAGNLRGLLMEQGLPSGAVKVKDNSIAVEYGSEEMRRKVEQVVSENFPILSGKEEGGRLIYSIIEKERGRIKDWSVSQALETIRNRVDRFGVREPIIQRQGRDEIVIQLPGLKDPRRAIKIIGKTAVLEFKLVDDEHSLEEALNGTIPEGSEILYQRVVDKETGTVRKIPYLIKKETLLTGDLLEDARVSIDRRFNEPYVSLTFNALGAKIFDRITAQNVRKRLAIILDDNVYSAPVIRERISGGRAQITGSFTMEEARDLAIVLRAGALPAPVEIIQNVTVGPSLGRDSIEKGIMATIIGGILVLAFMVFYYRLSGVLADFALFLNIVMLLGAMAWFEATLTLPGIAGIILTIGMGVDSNVLIFERIKEELRKGRTVRSAIDAGYDRAFWTIMDSHVTTLIAAAVLFQFGSGPIKGFAVTLSLGVIINLFTSLIGTKTFYDYITSRRRLERLSI